MLPNLWAKDRASFRVEDHCHSLTLAKIPNIPLCTLTFNFYLLTCAYTHLTLNLLQKVGNVAAGSVCLSPGLATGQNSIPVCWFQVSCLDVFLRGEPLLSVASFTVVWACTKAPWEEEQRDTAAAEDWEMKDRKRNEGSHLSIGHAWGLLMDHNWIFLCVRWKVCWELPQRALTSWES
jgi:hypothetical protein